MSEGLSSEVGSEVPALTLGVRAGSDGMKEAGEPRVLEVRDTGTVRWADAWELQQDLVARRKRGEIQDQLLIVEHPHVVTMGRNGHGENLLASPELLAKTGIDFHATNRGGDVTYHGPGQVVGYPILDLRPWKRDVVAYVRAVEQVLIEALAEFGIAGEPDPQATGVWVDGRKVAAIGIHISRWVTSHGFALNLDTDLRYFEYIVPCGLKKPVTSMRALGSNASRAEVITAISAAAGRVFNFEEVRIAATTVAGGTLNLDPRNQ
ncbi:MAG: lipoyl(octanoyl) transferase LipB [Bryobacteraceae bacterium]